MNLHRHISTTHRRFGNVTDPLDLLNWQSVIFAMTIYCYGVRSIIAASTKCQQLPKSHVNSEK